MDQDMLVIYLIVGAVALVMGLVVYNLLKSNRAKPSAGHSRGSETQAHSHDLRGTMTRWHH